MFLHAEKLDMQKHFDSKIILSTIECKQEGHQNGNQQTDKKYRLESKLSQEDLAEKLFVTRQTISNWENAKNYPDINSLVLSSALFDVSLDILSKEI